MSSLPLLVALRGRDADLARVAEAMATARVVTLWGLGGIGKTSLAIATLHAAAARGEATAFAALAGDRRPIDAVRTVAASLDVSIGHAKATDAAARIGEILAARGPILVALDNAETLVDEAARLVVKWAAAAPLAKFLVTSREPLGLRDERVIELRPLDAAPAVELLRERARAVRPGFDAPRELLDRLVARTEGIPLAIELCAARLDVLEADQLEGRLSKSLDVLRTPRRDVDERHRTLVASIDVSHRMLDADERRGLAHLSHLAGDFDLDAAEAIIETDRPALDVLESLVRKSLVRRKIEDGQAVRFGLFETVREFVHDEIDDATRLRHAHYFAARGTRVAARADGASGAAAVRELALIENDLATIVDAFIAAPTIAGSSDAVGALLALYPLAMDRGPVASFADRARLLASVALLEPQTHARVESALGSAFFALGFLEDARNTLLGAVAAFRAAAPGSADLAITLTRLARAQHELGAFDESSVFSREALAIADAIGDDSIAGNALSTLGGSVHVLGDLETAHACYASAVSRVRAGGDSRAEARVLLRVAFLAYDEGKNDEARERLREGRALGERVGDPRIRGYAMGYMGNTFRADGAMTEAIGHYEDAIALLRRSGDRLFEAIFHMDMGIVHLLREEPELALARLDQASTFVVEASDAHAAVLVSTYRALALAEKSLFDEARAVLARAKPYSVVTESFTNVAARAIDVLAATDGDIASATRAWLEAEPPALSEHVRLARRLLRRFLDRTSPPQTALVTSSAFDGAPTTARVRPPGGAWIELASRPSLAGIVAALVERRVADPGEPVAPETLLARGWPGERVKADAGAIRVRVAIAQLRKLGLAEILRSTRRGYFLDPNVAVIAV